MLNERPGLGWQAKKVIHGGCWSHSLAALLRSDRCQILRLCSESVTLLRQGRESPGRRETCHNNDVGI